MQKYGTTKCVEMKLVSVVLGKGGVTLVILVQTGHYQYLFRNSVILESRSVRSVIAGAAEEK